MRESADPNPLRLAEDLRELIRATLDASELVRIAETIAEADESLLGSRTKRELVRLICLKVRAGEVN